MGKWKKEKCGKGDVEMGEIWKEEFSFGIILGGGFCREEETHSM